MCATVTVYAENNHDYYSRRAEGRNPYVIPVGASSLLGTWGYIDAWQELMNQVCFTSISALIVL